MKLIGSFVICRSASLLDINELAISRFLVVILGVYEIPQGNFHYILYVESLIVLRSTCNQASVLPPANIALYSDIVASLQALRIPTSRSSFQHFQPTPN